MARIVELTAGHETRLAADVLRLRLVGSAHGAVLSAQDEQGVEITFRRIDSSTILVHPARGGASILVTPSSGEAFGPASRVGIDVQGEGSSEGRQVIVSQADVGALVNYEVARLEPLGGAEWLIVAAPAPAGERAPTAAAQLRTSLDERRYPWLAAGRYAVRRARGGAGVHPSGSPWAMVLDASVSMHRVFPAGGLSQLVELVGGILGEATGQLPVAMYSTGVTAPIRVDDAVQQPAALVEFALRSGRPPSWSIVTPVVVTAVQSGAQLVALVTDGAPGDVRDLGRFASEHPDTQLVVVAAGQSRFNLAGRPGSTEPEELGALVDLAQAPNVTVVAVDPATDPDGPQGVALAGALLRIA